MIGEGCDVGGRLWSCHGAALLHLVRLCGISAARRESRVLVSSSGMSVRSSMTFSSIRTERHCAPRSSSHPASLQFRPSQFAYARIFSSVLW